MTRANAIKPSASMLVQQSATQLRGRILAGDFGTSGELPPQDQLAEELGVSRTVLREGMRVLESQGLVSLGQGRPAHVRPVDPDVLVDQLRLLLVRGAVSFGTLLEVRRPVESEAAALAAQRATPGIVDSLRTELHNLEKARSLTDQLKADRQFHLLLAEASGNLIFVAILTALSELLDESRKRTLGNVGVGRAVTGHTAILLGILQKSPEMARNAMLAHLDEAAEDLWLNSRKK